MSIKIDKEFESLIPPLSDDEFKQLEKNCLRDGIRDPLILWALPNGDNILVDGHNRWKIAAQHGGMSFTTKCMEFDDRDEVKAWIIRNQFGRRNLDKWQRYDLAKELETIEQSKAKKRQAEGGGDRKSEKRKIGGGNVSTSDTTKTRDKMGQLVGVSGKTYDKMKRIDEMASPHVKEAVRKGEMSINKGYNTTFPKRPDPVKVAKEEHEQFKQNKDAVVSFQDVKIDQINQKIINNAMTQDVLKLIDCITKFGLEYGPIKLESWATSIDDDTATHAAGMIRNCHMILKNITDAIDRR